MTSNGLRTTSKIALKLPESKNAEVSRYVSSYKEIMWNIADKFDVHRAVHLNTNISIVKPTRCTNVSSLFYLLASGYPLASRQQYLFDKSLLLYVQS